MTNDIYKDKLFPEFDELIQASAKVIRVNYVAGFRNRWKPILIQSTSFLPDSADISQRFWHIKNNTKDIPVCKHCGSQVKFQSQYSKYADYCSANCANKSVLRAEKIRNTNIERYGVGNIWQHKEGQEKFKKSMLEKYGGTTSTNSPILKEKIKTNYIKKMINKFSDKLVPMFEIEDYKDNKTKHKWLCLQCNNEFENTIIYKRPPRCPTCYPALSGVSSGEKEVLEFVKSIYNKTIIENDRTLIYPLELDILLPDQKIAIEYCGLYWHSETNGKDEKYHLDKMNKCNEQGYRLITIFEDEWLSNHELVKSRLKTILLLNEKIPARKTKVEVINSKDARDFLDSNHIQGSAKASVYLGLKYNEELVSVMSFGKPRFNRNVEWELIRFATKKEHNVIGGANKLYSYFIKEYNPSSVISYCDLRWNTGTVYENLGFIKINRIKPNYFYFKDNLIRFSRNEFQKHKLKDKLERFDNQLTEVENMELNGWFRIFDCGNDSYLWVN